MAFVKKYIPTAIHRLRNSLAKRGSNNPHYGKKRPLETRSKISKSHIGIRPNYETRSKMSISAKKRGPSFIGKHHSDETKEKIRLSKIGKLTGCNHPRWKGGHENTMIIRKARRCREYSATGSHTLGEWERLKAQYNYTCPCCHKKEPFTNQVHKNLTEDHIIPLSKGGSNNIENIQPLCGSCNSKKRVKIIKFDYETLF